MSDESTDEGLDAVLVGELIGGAGRPHEDSPLRAVDRPPGDEWRLHRRRPRQWQSVRVPWAVGVLLLATLAASVPAFLGDALSSSVTAAAHGAAQEASQRSADRAAAGVASRLQQTRQSLLAFSAGLGDDFVTDERALARLVNAEPALLAVAVVVDDGRVIAEYGPQPTIEAYTDLTGEGEGDIGPVQRAEGRWVVPVGVTVEPCLTTQCERRVLLGAAVDLQDLLDDPEPTWLLDGEQVLATSGAAAHREPPAALTSAQTDPATASTDGEVLAVSPVAGLTLSERPVQVGTVAPVDLQHEESRAALFRIYIFMAALLVAITLVFVWLYVRVLRPLTRLEREADRLARRQIRERIEVGGPDEFGLISRSLERIREREQR